MNKWHWGLVGAMLALMFSLSLGSMLTESAIIDEVAHIPAAYSYVAYGDYRLNPEHPPLLKNLAGLPLQFLDLKFPVDQKSWTTAINGQWEAGWNFLYHIGNDPTIVLFWARLPILLLTVLFGIPLYMWVRRRWGIPAGLIAVFFYALSPNFLAHSHYVTTDAGASVFIMLALMGFVRFMEKPSKQNMFILSVALAGAQLAKFNGVVLYPFLGLIALVAAWRWAKKHEVAANIKKYVGGFISASAVSLMWIWLYYVPNTANMPTYTQDWLIRGSVVDAPMQWWVNFLCWLNDISIFKPLVQYILGVTMVFGRVNGGNVTYLNGEVVNGSFPQFFPILFMVKTHIALLIILAVLVGTLGVLLWRRRGESRWLKIFDESLKSHLAEWVLIGFALFYFGISTAGKLNLGIRHILPIYVPLFVVSAVGLVWWLKKVAKRSYALITKALAGVLLAWYAASTLLVYPYFLPYFNELIGGPNGADKHFSDSSVDWGQDLVRLKMYMDKHPEIKHFALDYFGGGDPNYYFCQRAKDPVTEQPIYGSAGYDCSQSKYEGWHSQYGRYTGQYIAVSETFLENDRYYARLNGTEGYEYLRQMEPVVKIGYSIHLYKLY